MAIEVRYGNPGLIGKGAYEAGEGAGINRVDNRERQLDFQRAMAQEAFGRDLTRMDIQNQYAAQEDERNLDRRLQYLKTQDDMERQQIKEKRDKYLSQKKQIDEMQAQGKIAPEQYGAAMRELQGRYGDVADVYIPPESVQQQMDQQLWTAPNGDRLPYQITKDGRPDPGKTYETWQRMENDKEEIRVEKEKAEYGRRMDRVKQETDIRRLRAGYVADLMKLKVNKINDDKEKVEENLFTITQARQEAMELFPDLPPEAPQAQGAMAMPVEPSRRELEQAAFGGPLAGEPQPEFVRPAGAQASAFDEPQLAGLNDAPGYNVDLRAAGAVQPQQAPPPETVAQIREAAQITDRNQFNQYIDSLPVDEQTKAVIAIQAWGGR